MDYDRYFLLVFQNRISPTKMKYVILRHEFPEDAVRSSHWDVMLQSGDVLKTWELLDQPHDKQLLLARSLPDHRLAYLDYEGPISGNRGHVSRVAGGEMQWLEESDGNLIAQLTTGEFAGTLTITTDTTEQTEHQRTILMFQLD